MREISNNRIAQAVDAHKPIALKLHHLAKLFCYPCLADTLIIQAIGLSDNDGNAFWGGPSE